MQPVSAETRIEPKAAGVTQIAGAPSGGEYGRAGGWYSRQRETSGSPVAAAATGRGLIRSGAPQSAGGEVSQIVTRPQGPQQPQQTILEWSRPPANVTPLPVGVAPAPAFPIHSAGGASTMLR